MAKKASVKRENPDALKALSILIDKINGGSTQVGWFPGAKYEDGTQVAYIAAIQEYGFENIPPRSFMRTTIATKKMQWRKIVRFGAKQILAGKKKPEAVMRELGLAAEGDIKKKITEINSPPLKDATIEARRRKMAAGKKVGSLDKPLVESEVLLTTLTHIVEQK
jgi:hypothetical protein